METGGTPAVTVVRSRAELSGYIGGIQDAGRQDGLAESGLAEAAAGYDDAWFASHILVLALFDEPSGSIRHEVEGVDADGNIRIARIYSDVMMCDMASHYLLLELDREYDGRPLYAPFHAEVRGGIALVHAERPETDSVSRPLHVVHRFRQDGADSGKAVDSPGILLYSKKTDGCGNSTAPPSKFSGLYGR